MMAGDENKRSETLGNLLDPENGGLGCYMDGDQVRLLVSAFQAVVNGGGYGSVSIDIKSGKVREIETTFTMRSK
jgi:hypothetical protein